MVPIIMLTALDSEADAVQGLEAGADDYVTKAVWPCRATQPYPRGSTPLGPRHPGNEQLSIGGVTLDRVQRDVTVRGENVRLTFSEFELLACLMSEPGHLFNRQELLRTIWGDSAFRDRERSTCTSVTCARSSRRRRRTRV